MRKAMAAPAVTDADVLITMLPAAEVTAEVMFGVLAGIWPYSSSVACSAGRAPAWCSKEPSPTASSWHQTVAYEGHLGQFASSVEPS
jgi:hypothetical protein